MSSNSQRAVTPNILKVLGYAGLLPFLSTTVVMLNAVINGPGLQSAAVFNLYAPYVFISYSAVILSFMAGTLWAKWESGSDSTMTNAAVLFSNVVSLTAWLALLMIFMSSIMTVFAVTILLVGFASLLWVERLSKTASDYWQMRVNLTSSVLLMHAVVIYLMLRDI
jgi:hypothetical protein